MPRRQGLRCPPAGIRGRRWFPVRVTTMLRAPWGPSHWPRSGHAGVLLCFQKVAPNKARTPHRAACTRMAQPHRGQVSQKSSLRSWDWNPHLGDSCPERPAWDQAQQQGQDEHRGPKPLPTPPPRPCSCARTCKRQRHLSPCQLLRPGPGGHAPSRRPAPPCSGVRGMQPRILYSELAHRGATPPAPSLYNF